MIRKLISTLMSLGLVSALTSCIDPAKTAQPDKVVLSMSDALEKKYPETPVILVSELEGKPDIVLVDVREQKEIDVSIIPGAITQSEFEKNKEQYKGKLIVPYCTIGLRSTLYTNKLLKQGLKAKNLKGGVLSFAHEGKTFTKDGKETKKVHVYGEAWNLLPKNYEGIFE